MSPSPNRVVAIATPLIFAPLAGAVTALAAKHAPGLDIGQGQLEAVFIAGATIAFAKSGLWLKGWQDYEKREQEAQKTAMEVADDPYSDVDEQIVDDVEGELAEDQFAEGVAEDQLAEDALFEDQFAGDQFDSDADESLEDELRGDVLAAEAR